MVRKRAAIALLLLASATAAADATQRERLLRELSAETEVERREAAARLENDAELTDAEVRGALAAAGGRAKALLLRVAGIRSMKGLVPEVLTLLSSDDPLVVDAAASALVSLGDDAVAAGRAALAKSSAPEAVAARAHLEALAARHAVEEAVVKRWRRKAGNYEGRFKDVAQLGWPVQPVLLAMLLDVPVEDRFLSLPETKDADQIERAQREALAAVVRSNRRGYRTFDPLPLHIEIDDLFDLAMQALKDVADLRLVGDLLETVSKSLEQYDDDRGPRLRPVERHTYEAIDIILFQRGRPERLERLEAKRRRDVQRQRGWGARAEQQEQLVHELKQHGEVLHQLRRFDEAARRWGEAIEISRKLGGTPSATDRYNLACAWSRQSAVTEDAAERASLRQRALQQLDLSLDRERSGAAEDLTREWVEEDGDLEALHADPRFGEIIRRRFEVAPKPGR
jgi:hypothetical protein